MLSKGDRVRWRSSGVRKSGTVVKVVPPNTHVGADTQEGVRQNLKHAFPEMWLDKFKLRKISYGGPRNVTSYLVMVKDGICQKSGHKRMPYLYWPRTSTLEKV